MSVNTIPVIKKEYVLEGLACANCAAKIERQVGQLTHVNRATVNFATKTMTLDLAVEGDADLIFSQADTIVHEHEPDIVVKDKRLLDFVPASCSRCDSCEIDSEHDHDEAPIGRTELIQLGIGVLAYLFVLVFNLSFAAELGLFLASYWLIGGDVVLHAARNIRRGKVFDENFLMVIATAGAFAIGEYPEAVAVMLFYKAGELLQRKAVDHSRRSISALMDIRPDYANLVSDSGISRVSPLDVPVGASIVVRPGEKVPLDGHVLSGFSSLDTSAITGESLPRDVGPGDDIKSGTINQHGLLTVKVTLPYNESTVAKILDLVQNASCNKAPTEQFITRFARYYTPAVVAIALALALIPPLVLPGATFATWLYRALIFLVVSCPCALVISIPLGFFGGIGGAARHGVLFKGGNYLEALNHVDTIVFDKTGTLTQGVFEVTTVRNTGLLSDDQLLELAAHAESHSSHPIGQSIIRAYARPVDTSRIQDYQEVNGQGILARFDGLPIQVGSLRLLADSGIAVDAAIVDESGSVVHLAVDGRYAGSIVISDKVRPDARQAIQELRKLGVRTLVMLTGDSWAVGRRIGRELGLDQVYAELLPDQKVAQLEKLELERDQAGLKSKLVFVGDGINDAPVLSRADIGIAMGGLGSDAAIEASDIVIMTDEPSKIASAIRIARHTRMIVLQNIVFALVIKGAVLLMGAAGLATMWAAVFADIGVALIAIFNALRVLHIKNV